MISSSIKKIPWWGWLIGFVIVVIVWQSLSGWAASRKLYNMILDQLREDQSQIIRTLRDQQTMYEKEIERLNKEIRSIERERSALKAKAERSSAEISKLKRRINELEIQLQNIVVSDDPDKLIDDLRQRGFSSIQRIP